MSSTVLPAAAEHVLCVHYSQRPAKPVQPQLTRESAVLCCAAQSKPAALNVSHRSALVCIYATELMNCLLKERSVIHSEKCQTLKVDLINWGCICRLRLCYRVGPSRKITLLLSLSLSSFIFQDSCDHFAAGTTSHKTARTALQGTFYQWSMSLIRGKSAEIEHI